jgi:hypothetical protein
LCLLIFESFLGYDPLDMKYLIVIVETIADIFCVGMVVKTVNVFVEVLHSFLVVDICIVD